jgi:hypothetical protein
MSSMGLNKELVVLVYYFGGNIRVNLSHRLVSLLKAKTIL